MQFGYMCGLNAIGGHELMHRREWYNKIGGTWPFTKFFYSHFLNEHIEGHHRYVATSDDPATAHKGESVYGFIIRSGYLSHY